ncbi:MAG: hypothetical protein MJK04_06840, partial [Psychrosphaera sp.]|nr:hypothetical protein [Psychrosphaera sp.]
LIVTAVDEYAVSTLNHMLASPKQVFTFFQTGEFTVDTLSCKALDGVALDWLELLEQDPQNPQALSRRIFIGADLDAPVKLENKPVLYQIRTSALCQLRLIDQQGNSVELGPKVQRSYLVNPQPVAFALAVQGKALQPIRLDVRGLLVNGLAVETKEAQGSVDWQVQDKDGNIILSGYLDLQPVQDMFEALGVSLNEETLLAKSSTFILAPPSGAKIIVQSTAAQALVSVFTRPLNLSHKDSYKDDFDQSSLLQGKQGKRGQSQGLPQWFMLLPTDANRLKADGLTRLIYRQQRPKIPDDVEPGLSQWQALKSVGDQPTYPLFVEKSHVGKSNAPKSESVTVAVAANYQLIEGEILANAEVGFSANFVVDRQVNTLSPKLVYVQLSAKIRKVQISIDGKAFDYWLGAQAGQITLPSINAGEHHISIGGSDNTRWYINHLTPNEQGHRIRSAYALDDTLTFEISKQSDKEWVTFQYFPAIAGAHNINISLKHRYESGEYVAHTLPNRAFAIPGAAPALSGEGSVYLLNQDKPSLARGYLLKFP